MGSVRVRDATQHELILGIRAYDHLHEVLECVMHPGVGLDITLSQTLELAALHACFLFHLTMPDLLAEARLCVVSVVSLQHRMCCSAVH